MTDFDDYYKRNMEGSYKACFWCLVGIVISVLFSLLTGCTPIKYIPVETVRVEYDSKTDTIIMTDTVKSERETVIREARPEDSVLLAELGIKLQANERLLIMLRKEMAEAKSSSCEIHTDTVYREKEVQVPYPVERKLNKWESLCLEYGKVMAGMSVSFVVALVLFIIRWIRKKVIS